MTVPPPEPWNDAWINELAQFDEALRLGRPHAENLPSDPKISHAQDFLERLQSLWPRAPKKIGPYVLVASLGQGAVGPCYLVEEPASLHPYVLKALWPDLCAHTPTRQQFVHDAGSAKHLNDSRLAKVRDVIDGERLCAVVCEYCPGLSMAQWRHKHPQPVPWDIAGAMIARVADILAAAHGQGLSHGNLKPSNIFLAGADDASSSLLPHHLHEVELRIADFALAKAVQQTRAPSHGGLPWPMPHYLAPEQLQQRTEPATPASDIYALGVLWYDLLTGRSPVDGATRAEILEHTRRAAPPPPRQYRPDVPEAVESLVLRCLHKDPDKRPATAQELGEAVRAQLPRATEPSRATWKRWLGWK